MQILEYKMDMSPGGMITPLWIEDGGYFLDSDNHTMVGKCRDNQQWKIPDTVIRLTVVQLEDRLVDLHTRYPYHTNIDPSAVDPTVMTEVEVRQLASDWAAA